MLQSRELQTVIDAPLLRTGSAEAFAGHGTSLRTAPTVAALIGSSLTVEDAYLHGSEHLLRRTGGNTGNSAFVRGLHDSIGGPSELFRWDAPAEIIRERCQVIVLACANQLGPHSDLGDFANHLEKIDLPIVAFGLGAQSASFDDEIALTKGTRRWVEVLAAHSPTSKPNIGVRGHFSHRQMEKLGLGAKASVTGCPSNFINTDALLHEKLDGRYKIESMSRIAAAAGLLYWPSLQKIEESLADIVDATQGLYITQHEINMIRIARGEFAAIDDDTLKQLNMYIRPKLSTAEFVLWCRRHAACFIDAASWMESLRNFDFVVGPRFHGVMLAMQAGTPGGVIAHDSRTLEMCETMCIPVRHAKNLESGVTLKNLGSTFQFDANAFRNRRSELGRRFIHMLQAGGIRPAAGLQRLAEA